MKKDLKNIIFIISGLIVISFTVIFSDRFILSGTSKSADICISCHEDESLTMEKDGQVVPIYVNPNLYKKSVHGGSECADCHLNYNADEIPHTKSKEKVNCNTCHDNLKGIEKSVHKSVDCYDCHSKHDVKPAKEIAKDQTANCLSCHKKKNIQQFSSSIHAKKNIGCEGCHKG